jgi:hypothetical protein
VLALGCGREVPHGGEGAVRPAIGPALSRHMEPRDFVPGDLDLVVRLDVSRMRSAIGEDATDQLSARALPSGSDEMLREALKHADVVWFGLRLADLDPGDRVVAIEGHFKDIHPSDKDWQPGTTRLAGVSVLDHAGNVGRDGTARLYVVGDRLMVFVSPVETDSVARMLDRGPDTKRGDPPADGFVGLDVRVRRLPAPIERRFPSFGAILAGLERIRASATLEEDGLHLDGQISAKSSDAADKALRFLLALQNNISNPKYAKVVGGAHLDRVESTVHLRCVVPAEVVRVLAASPEAGP